MKQFDVILSDNFDRPSLPINHSAMVIWENQHGNDCIENFRKNTHLELMTEVFGFIKRQGFMVFSMDISQFFVDRRIVLHCRTPMF